MAVWFMPSVIVPLGVIAITAVYAIYQAFAYPPLRMLPLRTGAGGKTAASQQLGGSDD